MDTHTTPRLRRLALLALALLVVLTGVGLGASPASAVPPTNPRDIIALGFDAKVDFVRVHWAPPVPNGSPKVKYYLVERSVVGQPNAPLKTWQVATAAPLVDATVQAGLTYSYRVRAVNDHGSGAWSQPMLASVEAYKSELWKFGNDAQAFVVRQYQDLLGRNPSFGERNTAVLNITNGTWTAGRLIDDLLSRPERAHRHQVIRLYQAYFGRNADHAGLEYWSQQITQHGKSINTVSNHFAASAEFKAKYGNLANAQFVTLVYQTVLDRTPNADEVAYWTGQLGSGMTRGKLMTHFSESPEYKGRTKGLVHAADVHDAMLGEASTGSELELWAAHIQAGGSAGDYGVRITFLLAYSA